MLVVIVCFYVFRTMKILCPAYIKCSASREKQQLVITHVELDHNHEVSQQVFEHYPECRRLNAAESNTLSPLVDLRVRPTLLQHMVQSTTSKPVTRQDIQNAVRRTGASGGKTKIDLLADEIQEFVRRDPSAAISVKTDTGGDLKILYFQTSAMKQMVANFPEVVLLDATYRTNKLKMPLFVFMVVDGFGSSNVAAYCYVANEQQTVVTDMVKTFVEFNDVTASTKCVIVDKDICEINAVREAFTSEPRIQLCEFHVKRAFKVAIGNSSHTGDEKAKLNSILAAMLRAADKTSYCDEKAEFERVANADMCSYFHNNCREMWVRYLCDQHMNLGNNTNNRVESHNSKIKAVLRNSDDLHVALRGLTMLHAVMRSEQTHECFLATAMQTYSYACKSDLVEECQKLLTSYAAQLVISETIKTKDIASAAVEINSHETGHVVKTSYGLKAFCPALG